MYNVTARVKAQNIWNDNALLVKMSQICMLRQTQALWRCNIHIIRMKLQMSRMSWIIGQETSRQLFMQV